MRCEQCNATICSYRQTAGECRFESIEAAERGERFMKVWRAHEELIRKEYEPLTKAAARLAEAVLFDWDNKVDIAWEVAKMTTKWEDKK